MNSIINNQKSTILAGLFSMIFTIIYAAINKMPFRLSVTYVICVTIFSSLSNWAAFTLCKNVKSDTKVIKKFIRKHIGKEGYSTIRLLYGVLLVKVIERTFNLISETVRLAFTNNFLDIFAIVGLIISCYCAVFKMAILFNYHFYLKDEK